MPGPISDSYDPEWGTSDNADRISTALEHVYAIVSQILDDMPPLYILDLVSRYESTNDSLPRFSADLTELEWRLVRFALERARESI